MINCNKEVVSAVEEIINNVKERGDEAVLDYCKKFDNTDKIKVLGKSDFEVAYNNLDANFKTALNEAAKRISDFHKPQVQKGYVLEKDGYKLQQLVRGLSHVVVYAPGGVTPYFSSVVMAVIPAKIAGVEQVTIMSPAKNGRVCPYILAAAHVSGADSLVAVGGAQAIAAAAFGTKTVKRADKIVGPGNIYVATAKRLLYGVVGIDMIAGPSDITIIADETANPRFVAADLLSQAEHDPNAICILLTTCEKLAKSVKAEIEIQLENLPLKHIAKKAIDNGGQIKIVKNLNQAVDEANLIAPEHLEIMTSNPSEILPKIKNAGSVFVGSYSPEPIGDYLAGANHVLPTEGTARFSSALSVDDFVKKIQVIEFSKQAFLDVADKTITLAQTEGFDAHANSVKIRKENE
jgi:histidinol dehydrogenase